MTDIDLSQFTTEQLFSLEVTNREQATRLKEAEMQHAADASGNDERHRAEMVRIAQQMLTENARSKPVAEREVTAQDITTYASELAKFIAG